MRELGQYLKEQREQKNISLEEVSVATKISMRVLQAIEDWDESKLPYRTFVRGFIQSYAKYLGLDPKEVLNRFQPTPVQTSQPPETSSGLAPSEEIEKNLPVGGKNIVTIAAIVIIVISIIIIQHVLSKREDDMRSGVQAITGDNAPFQLSPTPSTSEESTPEPRDNVIVAAKALMATPSPTPMSTPTPQPTPAVVLAPSSTPILQPLSMIVPTSSPQATPSPTPEPQIPVPQEVIIEALDKVILKISIDNKPVQEIPMNANQIQTFKAKSKITIETPDGGTISVIQNGFDLGVPGNLGQPKTLVFPK